VAVSLSVAWAGRQVVIGLWSAVTVEPFKSLPMKGCAEGKITLPRTLVFILNITLLSLPGFVLVAIEGTLGNSFWPPR
jgi:hypothetical protein